MDDMKRCVHCGERKPRTEFAPQLKNKDGLHPWCRVCLRASSKRSRLKKLEHYRAVNRAWNNAHYEQLLARNKEWRAAHREHVQAYEHHYYHAHKERLLRYKRENKQTRTAMQRLSEAA